MLNLNNHLPRPKLSFNQRLSDNIARIGGSWGFIIILSTILCIWISLNVVALFIWKWDPYPFILLNLFLSCLSAYQAPIILMAQNRTTDRDRNKAERDYAVNRKAEREVENMQMDLDELKQLMKEHNQLVKVNHYNVNRKLKKK
ncbi:MAG: DUF1003 domain-containing protein [Nanoarchaeota archaeon]|nr:DUF1003 domain-containing protein [Nanoarchaeota archaeon]